VSDEARFITAAPAADGLYPSSSTLRGVPVEPVITVVVIAGPAVTFLALAVALGTPPSLRRYADRSDR
jgi:hypothetical protein